MTLKREKQWQDFVVRLLGALRLAVLLLAALVALQLVPLAERVGVLHLVLKLFGS